MHRRPFGTRAFALALRTWLRCGAAAAFAACASSHEALLQPNAARVAHARLSIDATRTEGAISPLLYGQFIEFMFEGIKGGLHGELLRTRGFEQAPNAIGLPRDWERYPDDRNDDYGLNFRWDDSVAYPVRRDSLTGGGAHALRVDAGDAVIERHGVHQPRISIRAGVPYHATLWIKAVDYVGPVLLAVEQDADGGRTYAEDTIARVERGEWRRYHVVLRPDTSDPLARFVVILPGKGRLWLDQASLMPGDTAAGGADVVQPDSGAPAIDAVVSRSADGKKIYVKLVNTDPARAIDLRVEIRGALVGPQAEWEVLAGASPTARTSFSALDAIVPRVVPLKAAAGMTVRLPASSVSALTFAIVG